MKTCWLATGLAWTIITLGSGTSVVKADDLNRFTRLHIEPTVLYVKRGDQLRQILTVNVAMQGGAWAGALPVPRSNKTAGGHTCILADSAFGWDTNVSGWEVLCTSPGEIKLKIFRIQGSTVTMTAECGLQQMKRGLNRFTLPDPIPVKKGDLVGFYLTPGSAVAEDLQGGDFRFRKGDVSEAHSNTSVWSRSQAVSSVRAFDDKHIDILKQIDAVLKTASLTINSPLENRTVRLSKLDRDGTLHFLDVTPVDKPTPITITLSNDQLKVTQASMVNPEKKWKVYLFHSIHIDIGYTNPQEVVAQRVTDNLDKLLYYYQQSDSLSEEVKPVWNCEVAWVIDEYRRRRSPEQFELLMSYFKKGRFSAQALFCNTLSGLYSPEGLIRLLYFTASLEHDFDIPVLSAKQTDTPNFTYALPSILAGAGIRYLSVGQNRQVAGRRPKVNPFYWVGPDGSEVLVWHSQGYYRSGSAGARWLDIQNRIRTAQGESDVCDAIGSHGLHGDNATLRIDNYKHQLETIKAWNKRWAYPKIIVGTPYDMLSYVEKKFGPKIPRIRGDWGCDWEDGAASSALETGINRRAKNLLIAGETLAAIGSAVNEKYTYPKKHINEIYRNALLYDEHTWGSGESVSEPEHEETKRQWATKSAFANDALKGARSLTDQAFDALAGEIPTDDEIIILVYNPLSWVRTDVALVSLPVSLCNKKAIEVIDSSNNQPAPSQQEGDNLVFLARDIPSMGYKAFRLKEVDVQTLCSIVCEGNTIENRYYKVILDPLTGAVASIYDKQFNQELVDRAGPYRFNQYIYDNDGVRDMKYRRKGQEPPAGGKHGPEQAAIKTGIIGPVRGSIVSTATALMTPRIEQEIVLYSDLKRIDFINRLKKDLTYKVEQVYYAFPFAVDKPDYICELSGSIISATKDRFDCADKNWFAIQNWVDISNNNYGVTWASREAPLVEFVDIHDRWVDNLVAENGHLFSYIMNNVWETNYKGGQGGDFNFHYALTSHKGRTDRVRATRFGAELANPLLCCVLPSGQSGKLPADKSSFCMIKSEAVVLQCMKRAEDGRGIVIRLREVQGRDAKIRLYLPGFKFTRAAYTNLVEEDIQQIDPDGNKLDVAIKANAILTLRCW